MCMLLVPLELHAGNVRKFAAPDVCITDQQHQVLFRSYIFTGVFRSFQMTIGPQDVLDALCNSAAKSLLLGSPGLVEKLIWSRCDVGHIACMTDPHPPMMDSDLKSGHDLLHLSYSALSVKSIEQTSIWAGISIASEA